MKTVCVDLWRGQVRGEGHNTKTTVCKVPPTPQLDVRALFVRGYSQFSDLCRDVDAPGVALVAVDETTGAPAGLVRLSARFDRHVAAIVGRHDGCDLYLAESERLALRQLAVVLDPMSGSSDVCFRVFDLRTADGFVAEDGRQLRGLRVEGPAVLRCGGYAIFALPVGDPTDWPASAEDAWACLPERVYFDELKRCPEGSIARPAPMRGDNTSVVVRTHGPRDTGMRLVEDGDLAGTLTVSGPAGHAVITVGHQALRDGVLLGRYERCDTRELGDTSISRVHALLLNVNDRLLAIDTASTNGTRQLGRDDARVIDMVGDTDLELGGRTRIIWKWSS